MRSRLFEVCRIAILASSLIFSPPVGGQEGRDEDRARRFDREIRPLLEATCTRCHDSQKRKGGVDLSSSADGIRSRRLWRKVVEQVETVRMPPESERALDPASRETLLGWAREAARAMDSRDPDPGPSVLRRLNRAEYVQTVRDLLGIDFDPHGIPEDPMESAFDTLAAALDLPPTLLEKYFAAADVALDALLAGEGGKTAGFASVFFVKPDAGLSRREAARQILERFARRAYRRPPRAEEIDALLPLFDRADRRGETFVSAVRRSLKAVLVAPQFLYRTEEPRSAPKGTSACPVSDHELAVRLSYFLWSTLPDEELSALADAKRLSDPAVYDAEVRRMLAHPRARALADRFAVQWLQLWKLRIARPSSEAFPGFTPQLRQAMHDEAVTFFDRLRTEDRSVLELLDSDYAYVNQTLAKHYGLKPVSGSVMKKVALSPEEHRGGILGMGSILTLTSHSSRTSPTIRGKWILEVLLGIRPPPPPPDAGVLKEPPRKGKPPASVRELLALHAGDPTCASCQRKIDPLGFALENFDPVGHWRDPQGGVPLDVAGRLPSGESFNGFLELKRVIWTKRKQFVRNLAERMTSFALGRELAEGDEGAIDEIQESLDRGGYRFSLLVTGITRSVAFRYRRSAEQKD